VPTPVTLPRRSADRFYSITPWLEDLGYQNCFISAAFVGLAATSAFSIMIFFGKAFRKNYSERYWAIVARENEQHKVS
jgi:hypothetical protein